MDAPYLEDKVRELRAENARLLIACELNRKDAERLRAQLAMAGTLLEQTAAKLARVVGALEYEEGLDSVTPEYPCTFCGETEKPHSRDCRRTVRRAALAAAKEK